MFRRFPTCPRREVQVSNEPWKLLTTYILSPSRSETPSYARRIRNRPKLGGLNDLLFSKGLEHLRAIEVAVICDGIDADSGFAARARLSRKLAGICSKNEDSVLGNQWLSFHCGIALGENEKEVTQRHVEAYVCVCNSRES